MNMQSLKRPKAGETDDDLAAAAADFLASRAPAAARVMRVPPPAVAGHSAVTKTSLSGVSVPVVVPAAASVPVMHEQSAIKPMSLFAQQRAAERSAAAVSATEAEVEAETTRPPSTSQQIVGKVTEKDTVQLDGGPQLKSEFILPKRMQTSGFPVAKKLDRGAPNSTSDHQPAAIKKKQKKSLFAQALLDARAAEQNEDINLNVAADTPIGAHHFLHSYDHSFAGVSGLRPSDASSIHEQNTQKLMKMSVEEIAMEQEDLVASLPPELVARLLRRKAQDNSGHPPSDASSSPLTVSQTDHESLDQALAKPSNKQRVSFDTQIHYREEPAHPEAEPSDIAVELQNQAAKYGWLNMGRSETKKMAWMSDATTPVAAELLDESKQTRTAEQHSFVPLKELDLVRFDFQGHVVLSNADIPMHFGLHHHGKQPDQAGYTVAELMQLARSAVAAQRAIALNTLAAIACTAAGLSHVEIESASTMAADENTRARRDSKLLAQLSLAGVPMLARYALDDRNNSVVVAGAHLLWALCMAENNGILANSHTHFETPSGLMLLLGQERAAAAAAAAFNSDLDDPAVLCAGSLLDGLLQLRLLERLRYMLEMLILDSHVVDMLLDILTCFCCHSRENVTRVLECDRMSHVLGNVWMQSGHLRWRVVRLWRIIAQTDEDFGRRIVSLSVVDHCLPLIVCDLEVATTMLQSSDTSHALFCVMDALRLWRCLVTYGLFCGPIVDLLPLLLKQVDCRLDENATMESDSAQRLPAKVMLLHAVCIAASRPLQQLPPDLLQWSHIQQFGALAIGLHDHLWRIKSKPSSLFASLLHLLTGYLKGGPVFPETTAAFATQTFEFCLLPWLEQGGSLMTVAIHDQHAITLDLVHAVLCCARVCFTVAPQLVIKYGQVVLATVHHIIHSSELSSLPNCHGWHAAICELLLLATTLADKSSRHAVINLTLCVLRRLQPGEEFHAVNLIRDILFHTHPFDGAQTLLEYYSLFLGIASESGAIVAPTLDGRNPHACSIIPFHSSLPWKATWFFQPLEIVYDHVTSQGVSTERDMTVDNTLSIVTALLRFLVNLEALNLEDGMQANCETKVALLAKVFLVSNTIFMEPTVRSLLIRLVSVWIASSSARPLRFKNALISSQPVFAEIYRLLLDQYVAVSFADKVFGVFVALPLSQISDVSLRRQMWQDHEEMITLLPLEAFDMITCLHGFAPFIAPLETNRELLTLYVQTLGRLSVAGIPLFPLFWIAMYHICHAIFGDDVDGSTKATLLTVIRSSWSSTLVDLLHQCPLEASSFGVPPPLRVFEGRLLSQQ